MHKCVLGTAKGAGVGAVVGAAFHLIAGPSAMVIGQPNLRMQMIAKQAAMASARLGAVFAGYSAVKCAVDSAGYAASAPFAAGAVAVAVPFALNANRQQFLQAYFRESVKGAASMSSALAVGAGAISGACVFGLGSTVLDMVGANWV
ncbi:hypothetical protein FNF27_03256 [Cafeteria roenbergensis]|nr:hypothetical protein FNF31_02290 [Cafeteria roenbergensis]KAA0175248.1 hypothetical protein FNF27_03256 [Cafeteria roenbergensis]